MHFFSVCLCGCLFNFFKPLCLRFKKKKLTRSSTKANWFLYRSNTTPPARGWLFSPCVQLQGSDRQRVLLICGAGAVGNSLGRGEPLWDRNPDYTQRIALFSHPFTCLTTVAYTKVTGTFWNWILLHTSQCILYSYTQVLKWISNIFITSCNLCKKMNKSKICRDLSPFCCLFDLILNAVWDFNKNY